MCSRVITQQKKLFSYDAILGRLNDYCSNELEKCESSECASSECFMSCISESFDQLYEQACTSCVKGDSMLRKVVLCMKGIYEEAQLTDIEFADDQTLDAIAKNLCKNPPYLPPKHRIPVACREPLKSVLPFHPSEFRC